MINDKLDEMIPIAKCELDYHTDYELLIAVMLSAQSTDKRVNIVTKELFKYSLKEIKQMPIKDIEIIIKSVGTYHRKAIYVKKLAQIIEDDLNGHIPCNRELIESLPGVGHKTCNVFLSEIYNVPTIAVDTHVLRVCKRIGITKDKDNELTTEKKLMKIIPKEKWGRTHKQLVLFGRYICKANKPICNKCLFQEQCKRKIK